jgi:hypothetical protein
MVACSQLTPDFGNAAAIQITGNTTPQVEEGDTTSLTAQALDFSGNPIATDTVLWTLTTPIKRIDSTQTPPVNIPRGFTIDQSTGLITGVAPDTSTVLAYLGNLRSNTVTVAVSPRPDTVLATITHVSMALGLTESPAVVVTVEDLTTAPSNPRGLGGKRVVFQIAGPPSPAIYLEAHTSLSDTLPGSDPTTATAVSAPGGSASIYVHAVAGQTLPDSVTVQGTGYTARGAIVPGSPVLITVVFLKS